MSYIGTKDLMLEIARGNIEGMSSINKFGANTSVAADTKEDVWDGGGTYTFPTTADITHVHEASDIVADRGALINVQGLDANWDLVVQDVNLDATDTTTLVALTTPLIRVFRMKVNDNVVAGDTIYITNVGNTITYSQISAGNNQTLMAIYTVPSGKTAYMTGFFASVINATGKTPTGTEIKLWASDRDNGYEFQLKHADGVAQEGAPIKHLYAPYYKFTQKTDIKLTAEPLDQTGSVKGGFDLILVDN